MPHVTMRTPCTLIDQISVCWWMGCAARESAPSASPQVSVCVHDCMRAIWPPGVNISCQLVDELCRLEVSTFCITPGDHKHSMRMVCVHEVAELKIRGLMLVRACAARVSTTPAQLGIQQHPAHLAEPGSTGSHLSSCSRSTTGHISLHCINKHASRQPQLLSTSLSLQPEILIP